MFRIGLWIMILMFLVILCLEGAMAARDLSNDSICRSPAHASHSGPNKTEDLRWGLELIDVQKSWKFTLGDEKITVAIIDTGIDPRHPDLKDRLWINPGESGPDALGRDKSNNRVDDDRNGYVDDIHGWNFVSNNNVLDDRHGHGTHIAGIIGGRRTGVAPQVRLMILKFFDPSSSSESRMRNIVLAIEYATKMNADIINFSAGGPDPSRDEEEAIRKAGVRGILFVAAAGNDRSNSDLSGYYPADYDLSNIISVGALAPDQKFLSASNFGIRTVDLAAPGGPIFSTFLNRRYEMMSGTSQATAFVSGVAALLLSKNAGVRNPEKTIQTLTQTGKPNSHLQGKTRFRVQLNSYRAMAMKGTDTTIDGRPSISRGPAVQDEYGTDVARAMEARP